MNSYQIELIGNGGPDMLRVAPLSQQSPLCGDSLLIENEAIGLNFAEIYFRTGQKGPHRSENFPAIPGSNGAGVVVQTGSAVHDFAIGDRIAYIAPGCYATHCVVPAARAVRLPDAISSRTAAALLLRGLTAEYLTHRLFRVEAGMICLVHAAAGGVGQILGEWLSALGAMAIGTAGGAEKVRIARGHGYHHVIDYRAVDFTTEVARITEGAGVHVVYDAVGADVFMPSLTCLRPRGLIASYGAASGPVPPLDIQDLHARSLFVTRPTLGSYISTGEMLAASAQTFFQAIGAGWVTPRIDRAYALRDVAQAHSDLENRRTTGSAILIP